MPIASLDDVGAAWRALEPAADDPSFFQTWTWIGCLAEERFPDPVLLRAAAPDGRTLGLALFNRRAGRLCLAESGDPRLDAPFAEHNAPLTAAGSEAPAVLRGLLRAAWRVRGARRLVLGGVPPAVLAAAGGAALRRQDRAAPFVDLDAVRADGAGGDWYATLSANTRYQIRRSARLYAERAGRGGAAPAAAAAATTAQAGAWLDALIALHGETWRARGLPGAFADPFALRFHRALVARAQARGELELLRVAAGDGPVVGYLYNFRLRGRVYAYQSGLDHAGAGRHGKPGLTCHALAVERALAAGDRTYDFLGGADRYKLSLANAVAPLVWAELLPVWSPAGLAVRLARALWRRDG